MIIEPDGSSANVCAWEKPKLLGCKFLSALKEEVLHEETEISKLSSSISMRCPQLLQLQGPFQSSSESTEKPGTFLIGRALLITPICMTATGLVFCKKEMLLSLGMFLPSKSTCKDLIQRRLMQCSLAMSKGKIAVFGI